MNQVLSQEEVDALLSGVSEGEIKTETDVEKNGDTFSLYDLTGPTGVMKGRMPALEIVNQKFSRMFRVSLSTYLRRLVDVNVNDIETGKFGEFLLELPMSASMHIFKMKPLRGYAMLVMDSNLAYSIIDTFFGGSGKASVKSEGKEFTVIEQRIIKNFVDVALKDIERSWKTVQEIHIVFDRSEVNPQFVGIVSSNEIVIKIKVEIELNSTTGGMTLCFPYSTIEPMKEKLCAEFQNEKLEITSNWVNRLRELIFGAHIDLIAVLGEAEITGRELLNLNTGDVLQLKKDPGDTVEVKIEGLSKIRGIPGIFKGNKAISVKDFG